MQSIAATFNSFFVSEFDAQLSHFYPNIIGWTEYFSPFDECMIGDPIIGEYLACEVACLIDDRDFHFV